MNTYNNRVKIPETSCWSEKLIPLIAMYMLICTLLYIAGVLDMKRGPGVILLVVNLSVLTMFAGYVMMYPELVYIGGCD